MRSIITFLEELSNTVNQEIYKHRLASFIIFILPYLLIMIVNKHTNLNILFVFLPWIVLCLGFLLKCLSVSLSVITIAIVWFCTNFEKLKHTLKSLILIVFSFLILLLISLGISIYLFDDLNFEKYIKDPVFNGQFLPNFYELALSVLIFFVLFLFYHLIFVRINKNEWVYQVIDIFLTFTVVIGFAFILGLNSTISDYIVLLWKDNVGFENLKNLNSLELEQSTFYIKSSCNLILYWIFAIILSFQSTFKIANKYRTKNKIN